MAVVIFLLVLAVFVSLIVLAVALLMPAVSEAVERVRIEREAAEASWKIHQGATAAFGQMLKAAREAEAQEPTP
jgi:type IV secretory pathway TrbL component